MTYSESPFSHLSDELWHVFGGRRKFPTTRALGAGQTGHFGSLGDQRP